MIPTLAAGICIALWWTQFHFYLSRYADEELNEEESKDLFYAAIFDTFPPSLATFLILISL